jgi:hypothetical protein
MDTTTDSPADGRWMTLAELATSRRISVASAARLMRRRRWRRQPGNDGHIRVWVPIGEQEPKAEDRPDARPDVLAGLRAGVMEVVRPLQPLARRAVGLPEQRARATPAR